MKTEKNYSSLTKDNLQFTHPPNPSPHKEWGKISLVDIKSRKVAFTLAEVLITLGIIVVVAAVTMPTLISNHKKKVTVEKLKTAYSIFYQAIEASKLENGPLRNWDYTLSSEQMADKYVLPYLKPTQKLKKIYYIKTMHKTQGNYLFWTGNIKSRPIYALPNGMTFVLCPSGNGLPYITVDINGKKGPNVMGIDTFAFIFNKYNYDNKNYPRYEQLRLLGMTSTIQTIKTEAYSACSRTYGASNYAGAYCGALIMKNGWQITDDYPWGNGGLTPKE